MTSTAPSELLTVRDLIRYGVSRLNAADVAFGHGSDNAYDEVVYLVLSSLHLPADLLEPFLDARVLRKECQRVLDLFERRTSERIPVAYLTKEAWLGGHRFYVDNRVIIPRSPISELLAEELHPWIQDPGALGTVLDLCTGSGCLAILAAIAFPDTRVDATDISDDALEVARRNVKTYHLQSRLTLHRSDLFDQLPASTYDLIICNPPYVNGDSMDALPAEYRHEPGLALAGGRDGMDLIRRIVRDAGRFLSNTGLLILEIGHEREYFERAFPHLEPVWLQTAQSHDQILLLTREQLTT